MRTRLALLCLLIFTINNVFAHSPHGATYSLYEEKSFIYVDAEFPWTISKAIYLYDSSLNQNPTRERIQEALFRYVKQNFVIKNLSGDELHIKNVVSLNSQGHHENYRFIFKKDEIGSIRNTLMFNFSDKQKNHHTLSLRGIKKEFLLNIEKPEITIQEKKLTSFIPFIGIAIIFMVFIGILVRKKAKLSS